MRPLAMRSARSAGWRAVAAASLILLAACAGPGPQTAAPRPQAAGPQTASGPAPKLAPMRPAYQADAPVPPTPPVSADAKPAAVAPAMPGAIKVGVLLPLSGRNAQIGKALMDAAEMAVFEFADDAFTLIPVDVDQHGAAAAAAQAIEAGAQLLLGPIFASQAQEAAPIARERGVAMVTFSSDKSIAGDGVYVLGLPPEQAVARAMGYARQRGAQGFAALLPNDALGQRVAQTVRDTAPKIGAKIGRIEFYAPGTDDLAASVKRVADFDKRRAQAGRAPTAATPPAGGTPEAVKPATPTEFQALIMAEQGLRQRMLAPLLPFYDVDPEQVKFIGTPLWEDGALGQEKAMLGAWFAAPDPAGRAEFETRYRASYGRQPPRIATLAYDGVALAAVLARGGKPNYDAASLTAPSGFAGIDGLFRLGADGVVERGMAVLEIRKEGTALVDAAPKSFTDSGRPGQ